MWVLWWQTLVVLALLPDVMPARHAIIINVILLIDTTLAIIINVIPLVDIILLVDNILAIHVGGSKMKRLWHVLIVYWLVDIECFDKV